MANKAPSLSMKKAPVWSTACPMRPVNTGSKYSIRASVSLVLAMGKASLTVLKTSTFLAYTFARSCTTFIRHTSFETACHQHSRELCRPFVSLHLGDHHRWCVSGQRASNKTDVAKSLETRTHMLRRSGDTGEVIQDGKMGQREVDVRGGC
jgi:hypothetical protein